MKNIDGRILGNGKGMDGKQRVNSLYEELWYLVEEDEEEESYVFDINEFLAIQVHNSLSSNSAKTDESLYSTLDERYDAIFVDDEVFNLLRIDDDLFNCDTPLGEIFDEFRRLTRVCYDENEQIYAEAVIIINKRLVRLIGVTVEHWLNLKFRDHKKIDKEVMEEVVNTWLIRNYKKQFDEYMEIKKQLEVRGDDEEVLTDDE
ncbi:hypothetical protein Tco_0925561 [Tanacetum coccineum]|uniref:Uncharacterized protein n=1 Tax=Tanacetum coccineum TaxID=301880 RepID=A0ABQ5D857_9ASTR